MRARGLAALALAALFAPGVTTAGELASLLVSPPRIEAGEGATGRVTLRGPAPKGGAPVTLTTPDWLAVELPQGIVVPEGASSATFSVTAKVAAEPLSATIVATRGEMRLSAPLAIVPPIASLVTIARSVPSGDLTTGVVRLSLPAPFGGRLVTLAASAAGAVPASVRVPAGATVASFAVRGLGPTPLRLTATAGRMTREATVALTAGLGVSGLSPSRSNVAAGGALDVRLELNGRAPAGGLEVTLGSDPSGILEVPPTVRVAEGESQTTFRAKGERARETARIVAGSGESAVRSPEIHVTRNVILDSLSLEPESLTGGNDVEGVLELSGPAPSGFVVSLRSDSPGVSLPARVPVPRGAASARFRASTRRVEAPSTATLTASQSLARRTATLRLLPGLSPAGLTFNEPDLPAGRTGEGRVRLSAPAPEGGATVYLVASEEGRLRMARTVIVPAGRIEGAFLVERLPDPAAGAAPGVVVQASYAGVWVESTLGLPPAPPPEPTPALSPTAMSPAAMSPTATPSATPEAAPTATLETVPPATPTAEATATPSPTPTVDPPAPPIPHTARDWKHAGASQLLSVRLEAGTLRSGRETDGLVTLTGPAGEDGADVSLVATRPALLELPASVTVPPGETSARFTARALDVTEETAVSLSASYAGVIRFARLRLRP